VVLHHVDPILVGGPPEPPPLSGVQVLARDPAARYFRRARFGKEVLPLKGEERFG